MDKGASALFIGQFVGKNNRLGGVANLQFTLPGQTGCQPYTLQFTLPGKTGSQPHSLPCQDRRGRNPTVYPVRTDGVATPQFTSVLDLFLLLLLIGFLRKYVNLFKIPYHEIHRI